MRRVAFFFLASVGAWLASTNARADDRAEAQALVSVLDGDTAHKDVIAGALAGAKDALERALRMHRAGDDPHAHLAEGLALERAQLAQDQARTADMEKRAADAQKAVILAKARVERERAMLEEAIARSGRIQAELAEAKKPSAKARAPAGERPKGKTDADAPSAPAHTSPASPAGK